MGAMCCAADGDDYPNYHTDKLSEVKVNYWWNQKRGSSDPTSERVKKIMNSADANKDGVLNFEESSRMCKKFLKHSGRNKGDEVDDETLEGVFKSLDGNNDGMLDKAEVELALKAMWLMYRDDVPLEDLCGSWNSTSGGNGRKGPKLSRRKVENTWLSKRGNNAEGPDAAAVDRVMQKSKKNGSGSNKNALNRAEAERISRAFRKKANRTDIEVGEVFDYIDTNSDGVLDKDEIALAMKAMWLMSTDGVKLNQLLQK